MRTSPRCGAKTRRGTDCLAPKVAGKKRCHKHGGAHGSGAPKGNQNRLIHGFYTEEEKSSRRRFTQLKRSVKSIMSPADPESSIIALDELAEHVLRKFTK